MIYVLGLRPERINPQEWFDIKGSSVENLFANLDVAIAKIPPEERYNCHYTLSHSETDDRREFSYQDILPIDIDHVQDSQCDEIAKCVVETLRLDPTITGVVYSGHGVHILIKLAYRITEVDYFTKFRSYYNAMADTIDKEIRKRGLEGTVDKNLFCPSHLLRLPNTENRKDGMDTVMCRAIATNIEECAFDLTIFKPLVEDIKRIQIRTNIQKEGVLSCPFVQWAKDHPNDVSEPQWHALIGVLSWIPNEGDTLCHEASQGYTGYSYEETERYISKARLLTGPRTCANIAEIFEGCRDCPITKADPTINTPAVIKTEDYIQTQDTGFHKIIESANGGVKYIPDYEGLVKYFKQNYNYVTVATSDTTYIWKEKDFEVLGRKFIGGCWHAIDDKLLQSFALSMFKPHAMDNVRKEFASIVKLSNTADQNFLEIPEGFLNFSNGILDVRNRELLPHSKEFGFTYKLPFDYEPTATCPKYDDFLEEVLDSKDIPLVVNEYMASAAASISNSMFEKALMLHGEGANGKSVLMNVMKYVFGNNNWCSVGMGELGQDTKRSLLISKLINIVPEENKKTLLNNSDLFKTLVSGEEVTAKFLYKDGFKFKPKAKMVFSYNTLPFADDHSDGFYRRFIILYFPNSYLGRENRNLANELCAEASGIWNRIIEAYIRLLDQKRFTTTLSMDEKLDEYKYDSDNFAQFLDEYVTIKEGTAFEKGDFIPIKDIYAVYAKSTKENGQYQMSLPVFSTRFRKILHKDRLYRKTVQSGQKVTVVEGIKLATHNTNSF